MDINGISEIIKKHLEEHVRQHHNKLVSDLSMISPYKTVITSYWVGNVLRIDILPDKE